MREKDSESEIVFLETFMRAPDRVHLKADIKVSKELAEPSELLQD